MSTRACVLVGQLSTWKWHYCALSVKSVRFGRECKQSRSNIFLIYHILWHFQDDCHWPWEFHMGEKLKHAPVSLKIVSNCLSCHKNSAILEMPQYVAYQKNVAYAFIKLSAKSHSFNILCTMDVLSCPTMCWKKQEFVWQNHVENG